MELFCPHLLASVWKTPASIPDSKAIRCRMLQTGYARACLLVFARVLHELIPGNVARCVSPNIAVYRRRCCTNCCSKDLVIVNFQR